MAPDPLATPIGALTRPDVVLDPVDSLSRAGHFFRDNPGWQLPVVEEGRLVGIVTDVALARTLAAGASWKEPVRSIMLPALDTIEPQATGADALRRLSDLGLSHLFVVNAEGYYFGAIGVSDLMELPAEPPRPQLVGGMATPFGVYLTNGDLRAGASGFALVCTGFLLFALFVLSDYLGLAVSSLLPRFADTPAGEFWLRNAMPLVAFLVSFRQLPMAGIHAAEHMAVHAIERGEPLELDVVKRMPRIHPRCGTNIATGVSLFVGVHQVHWIPSEELRVTVAAIVALFFWRSLGSLVQKYVTTRPPTDRQVMMGIRSAQELLEKYAVQRGPAPSPGHRIVASGMLHAMAGSLLAGAIYGAIEYALGRLTLQ